MAGKYRNLWYSICKNCLRILPDVLFHNVNGFVMHKRFGCRYHWMNIKSPKTFSEKLQYLKTHPVCQNQTELADKYEVREFVRSAIGEKYLIPLIGVYSSVDEIDFDALPNEFVLKLTKGSGYNLIVKDKSKLDISGAKAVLSNWLKVNPYYFSRERQYLGTPRLVCEQMLEYNITDYKFFCFNGKAVFVELYMDRFGNHKKLFYDMNWERVPFTTAGDVCEINVEKPEQFDEMREIAEKLAEDMAFVRVDLYLHDSNIYFGELTFYPAGGYTPITPREYEIVLGDLIQL